MLDRRVFWLAATLRLGVYVFLHYSMGIAVSGSGLIGRWAGDTNQYVDSIENLLAHGRYSHALDYLPAAAGRMPGYGAVYGLLRLLMPQLQAYDGMVVLQMALAIVSLYYLGQLAYALSQRRAVAYTVVLVYAISPYGAQSDLLLLTESFAASALLIGSYSFWRGLTGGRPWHFLVAGAWLTWVIFLRPYMAPLLGVWPVVYLYHLGQTSRNWRGLRLSGLLFLLPFTLLDGAWTVRNWVVCRQFIPLQSPYAALRMAPVYLESRRFAAALGEDPVQWNTASLMAWLTLPRPLPEAAPRSWQLTRHGTYDSLVWVRQRIQAAKLENQLPPAQQRNTNQAIAALSRFHDAVVRERPALYYLVAPLRLTYLLVLTGGGNSIFAWPFGELALWQKGIRLFFTFSHWLIMGAGLLSYLAWPRRRSAGWLLVRLPPIYLILFFVLGLRYVESRYFIVVYPLTLLSGVVWLTQVWEKAAVRLRAKATEAASP